MKPCTALIVMAGCVSSQSIKYLGPALGYSDYSRVVSPSLLAPRSALDVLALSPSPYPGNHAFFNQLGGVGPLGGYLGFPTNSIRYAPAAAILPEEPVAAVEEAVDVTEAVKEAPAPVVTIAHHIDAIPSPPVSPFRTEFPQVPAGLGAQSTQPIFTHELFKNPKFASHHVIVANSKVSPVLKEIQLASGDSTPVVRVF